MFTESTYENAVIQLFEGMGYTHIYAPDMGREDFTEPLMENVLRDALVRINRGLPTEAIGEAMAKIRNFDGGSLIEKNRTFTGYLQNGVEVNYAVDGETRSALVRLVDFEKVENNEFAVVNQYTYIENGNNRRPDIILFVNGLPLVLMELKSPAKRMRGPKMPTINYATICRTSRLCSFTMLSVLSATFRPTAQGQSHRDLTVLWTGRLRTADTKTPHMRSLIHSMRECFRRSGCLIF